MISKYIPDKSRLALYHEPNEEHKKLREIFLAKKPGAIYVLTYDRTEQKLIIVPSWHPLNQEVRENPAHDYAQLIFEGMSINPVSENGKLVGANMILYPERFARLQKSAETVGLELPVSSQELNEAIKVWLSVLGGDILRSKNGELSRAYIRPVVSGSWEQSYGVGGESGVKSDLTVLSWNWPKYIPDRTGGLEVALFLDTAREHPVIAKEARNYAHGRKLRARADKLKKELGIEVDEILCPGPYKLAEDIGGVVPADGIGEDLFLVSDSGVVRVQPKDTYILAGTTRQFGVEHMFPKMGLTVSEKVFSLSDLQSGKWSMLFAGNAVGMTVIGKVRVFDSGDKLVSEISLPINTRAQAIGERYSAEVSGKISPSSPSLLTPVDLGQGQADRSVLDQAYQKWVV